MEARGRSPRRARARAALPLIWLAEASQRYETGYGEAEVGAAYEALTDCRLTLGQRDRLVRALGDALVEACEARAPASAPPEVARAEALGLDEGVVRYLLEQTRYARADVQLETLRCVSRFRGSGSAKRAALDWFRLRGGSSAVRGQAALMLAALAD